MTSTSTTTPTPTPTLSTAVADAAVGINFFPGKQKERASGGIGGRRCCGVQHFGVWGFARVGEGFNFVRDYYFGFNSSFYGSLGIIMSSGVVWQPIKHQQGGTDVRRRLWACVRAISIIRSQLGINQLFCRLNLY